MKNSNIQKQLTKLMSSIFILALAFFASGCSQEEVKTVDLIRAEAATSGNMYVIEREVEGAGSLSQQELKDISIASCDVLEKMGSDIDWLYSYVTQDMIYCVFNAANEGLVKEHAELGGFPLSEVNRVYGIIDPSTSK